MFNVIVSHPWRGFSLCGGNGRRREGEKTPAEKLMTNDATEGSMGGISNRICLYVFFFSSLWLVELLSILMVALSQWQCVVCGGC